MKKLSITTVILSIISLSIFSQVNEDYSAIQAAHDLYYDRKYAEALNAYEKLLQKNLTENTKNSISINSGRCNVQLGNDADAIKIFEAIIVKDPNGSYATQAVYQIGNLYVQRYQYSEGTKACRSLVDRFPNSKTAAIASYLEAQYLYYNREFDSAIDRYRAFLKNYPNSPYRVSVVQTLVRIYTSQQRENEAESLILDQLKIQPQDTDLMEQLADIYKSKSKYAEALELYQNALARSPNDPDLLQKLGELYSESGDRDRAIEIWSKITNSNPNQYYRFQQLAKVYVSNQIYDKAIEAYEKAISINPRSAHLYSQLADVHKIRGDFDNASDVYLRGLEAIDPNYGGRSQLIEDLVEVHEFGEKRDQFLDGVIKKISAKDQSHTRIATLAELNFYRGDLDQSLTFFKKLKPIYPTDQGRLLEKYAQRLDRMENPEAIRFYQTLVDLYPTSHLKTAALRRIGDLQTKHGRHTESVETLKKISANDITATLRMAQIYLDQLHDPKSATQILNAIDRSRLTAEYLQIYNLLLSKCYIWNGRPIAAINILAPIAERSGKYRSKAQRLIGDANFVLGKFDEAIEAYKKLLSQPSSDQEINDAIEQIILIQSNSDLMSVPLKRYADAISAFRNGDEDKSLSICDEIINSFVNAKIIDDAYFLIGKIHRRRGNLTEAIMIYNKVIDLEKSDLSAKCHLELAEIHKQKGDLSEAIALYSNFLKRFPEHAIADYARQQMDGLRRSIR